MNIILCGQKYAGKTTLGQMLATNLKRQFIDTDQELLAAANEKSCDNIAALYRQLGEQEFRQREAEVVARLATVEDAIIALGGGLPMQTKLHQKLKLLGQIIYLYLDEDSCYQRLQQAANLPAYFVALPEEKSFARLFKQRDNCYRQVADITVDVSGSGFTQNSCSSLRGRKAEAIHERQNQWYCPSISWIASSFAALTPRNDGVLRKSCIYTLRHSICLFLSSRTSLHSKRRSGIYLIF